MFEIKLDDGNAQSFPEPKPGGAAKNFFQRKLSGGRLKVELASA